jgi:SpoVK/Ycf46/Vps4 family AAA+-type ATPase
MSSKLFEEILELPDADVQKRFDELVGLDIQKNHLLKQAKLLLNPGLLNKWSKDHYQKEIKLLNYYQKRPPLFLFSGDVGTGKTSLAETFGNSIALDEKIGVTVYRLSLKTRGDGTVGDMTKMISSAFEVVYTEAKKHPLKDKKPKHGIILLIDEADALAQSRESAQMHHEDRAGVNALIRGIDTISAEHLPVIVIMCTNRLSSIDPAVKRRAAMIFDFVRPGADQRKMILQKALADCGITDLQLDMLVEATGANGEINYGYTYSDISQRLLPGIVINFFPDRPIDFDWVIEMAKEIKPTPPFKEEQINI